MRVGVIGGLLLAFCVSAVPASAAVQASTAAKADPQAIAAGLRFARAVYSEASQLAIADRMVEVELGAMFRNNADFKTLEGEYPGFTDAVLREFKVVLVRYTRSSLPDYHERIASLMASRLNAEEIADLTQFYLTPTGQKLLRGMSANATAGAMLSEVAEDPDKPTSLSAVTADHSAAAQATVKMVDVSDKATLIALTQKPYFERVKSLAPEMRKLEQDMVNEPAPEFEKEVEEIISRTLARYQVAKGK